MVQAAATYELGSRISLHSTQWRVIADLGSSYCHTRPAVGRPQRARDASTGRPGEVTQSTSRASERSARRAATTRRMHTLHTADPFDGASI